MAPTAIVTGASGGIGEACVRALASDHDVLVHYHTNREAAQSLADEVARETENGSAVHGCDVSSPEAVASMVDHARDAFGPVAVLASTGGTRGSTKAPAYSAAKGGMIAFTKTLARIYTGEGILSNAVAPSATDTPMYPDDRREEAASTFPQGRMIRPEEVAEAVRFFATASYVSGEVLEVDGGKYT